MHKRTIGLDVSIVPMGGGIPNYIEHLLLESEKIRPDIQFKLFYNSMLKNSLPNHLTHFNITQTRIPNRVLNLLWNRLEFPPIEWLIGNVDLFHSPAHSPVYAICPPAKKWVVTVNDLYTFKLKYKQETQSKELSVLHRMERRADRVIAISESTRNDLIELSPHLEDRTVVIQDGVDSCFFDAREYPDSLEKYGLKKPYILYVGCADPHKNLKRLVKAFAQLSQNYPHSLVLAGKITSRHKPIFDLVEELNLGHKVIFPDTIETEDLPSVYKNAELFAFPSLYEGFGLVLLEAMAAGTPVVTSNIASLPEVVGNAGILFDPYDELAIYEAMRTVLDNTPLQVEMKAKGRERAHMFSWGKTALETLCVYEDVIQK